MASRALLFSADPHSAALLRKGLGEISLTVDECCEPADALAHLANTEYKMAIIDTVEPPVRDGVLRQLRCTPPNKETLVIVSLSSHASAENAFGMGANFVLRRPLDSESVRMSFRAAKDMLQKDKRRARRAAVFADADISCPAVESAAARLLDLSEDGLSLQSPRGLPDQGKIYFRFTLPGQTRSIQLSGQTMWQDSAGRMGVRFVDVPQSARRLMKEWLDLRLSIAESKVRFEVPQGQAEALSDSTSDRRLETRHSCRRGVEVYRAGKSTPHRCVMTEISTGGCYVEMPTTFPVGTKVELVVRADNFKYLSGGTVRSENRAFGMGIALDSQKPDQIVLLEKLIAAAVREKEEKEAESDNAVQV